MPKIVKIQLPEIEVSDDVKNVIVILGDKNRNIHNLCGTAHKRFDITYGVVTEDKKHTEHFFICGFEYTKEAFKKFTQPPKEMTVEEVENILGYKVKIVSDKK